MNNDPSTPNVKNQIAGLAAAVAGLSGAVAGPFYLAPESAGIGGLAVCIVVGAIAGWAAGYLVVASLGKLLGWKFAGTVYVGCLLIIFALLGGVAGYHLSGGRFLFGIAGAVVLAAPNAILLYSRRRQLFGGRTTPGASSVQCHQQQQQHWPLWMRMLSGTGAGVAAVLGTYMAITQKFGLRHANNHGQSLELTGAPAVLAGVAMAVWGSVFLLYVVYPDSSIWQLKLGKSKDHSSA